MARSSWLGVCAVAAVAAHTLVAGCSRADPPPDSVPAMASVDYEKGTIELPLDRYWMTRAEELVAFRAADVLEERCLRSFNLHLPPRSRTADPEIDFRYGVWTEDRANEFAYSDPTPARPALDPTVDYEEIGRLLQGCHADGLFDDISDLGDPAISIISAALYEEVIASREAQEVIGEWSRCLQSAGVKHLKPTDPGYVWFPLGDDFSVSERSRSVAIKDVRCKMKVRLVDRLVALESRAHESYIVTNRDYLDKLRNRVDQALRRANEIIVEGA